MAGNKNKNMTDYKIQLQYPYVARVIAHLALAYWAYKTKNQLECMKN